MVHAVRQPSTYLEVGVQFGTSLALATGAQTAIGIDPRPLAHPSGNQQIFAMTADDYFQYYADPELSIDFAFIDGSHIFEDALRDFINVEMHSHENTVVVFDDMLPYNNDIAVRAPLPGDWTGDVWKLFPVLNKYRPDLKIALVDTSPTGTMLVWGLDRKRTDLALAYGDILDDYAREGIPVPAFMLNRSTNVVSAALALASLENDK